MLLLPGIAAFALFIAFDLNKIRWHRPIYNSLFPMGGLLLALSTTMCMRACEFHLGAALAGAVLSAAALIYALFFALPFESTYKESGSLGLVNRGIYGMCRHPGFWPFLLLYIFLYLSFPGRAMLSAAIIFPICNLIYIIIQDKYIFPLYIEGYDSYKSAVPFLFPRLRD